MGANFQVSRRLSCMLAAGLAVFWVSIGAAQAGQEIEPAQRIGVFGDSLADGLWIGVQRGLRYDDRAGDIVQLSEVSTGLTNYVYRDISDKTRDQLAQDDFDIAIILFGSNDIQGIRTDEGVFRFRSEGWEQVYRARIRDLVTQMQDDGARVYWVGLPVMRSASYNNNTLYLNSIFREEVEALGAVFVSTRAVSGDENGEYAPYLPDERGSPRLVRNDDGIHFTLNGYIRLAGPVVDAVRYGWDNPVVVAASEVAEAHAEAETRPAGWLDLLINSEAYLCQPVGLDGESGVGAATGGN